MGEDRKTIVIPDATGLIGRALATERLLPSCRAEPASLLASNFSFKYGSVKEALDELIG